MKPRFEEALTALLDDYTDWDAEEIISALELALYAKREESQPD